ncbi:2-amino-4-hydroxy-6-hydroxymethyldihydropteridine diphosphokinase [Loktanella sp. SALINAS62]|uniref:2-amino-4-hydroxy-6- hydroxymethyldihydropteridine diphosphokinase n=1 Tax=Loktanella sp. SALINAS62 TaxID=2706124 RepID=UPI0032C3FE6E
MRVGIDGASLAMSETGKLTLIAIGGNAVQPRADRAEIVATFAEKAAAALAHDGDFSMSHLYATPAYPVGIGNEFVNAAIALHSLMDPDDILQVLHDLERHAGRIRTKRWGPRPIDLDLVSLGNVILPDVTTFNFWRDMPLADQQTTWPTETILPHPRVQDRGFVLIPLSDVAPDWVHPVSGLTVRQMRDALRPDQLDGIKRIDVETS